MRWLAALVGLTLVSVPRGATRTEAGSPCLLVTRRAPGSSTRPRYDRAATVLLRGLPAGDVKALADDLEATVEHEVAEAVPLYLETEDPSGRLDAWMAAHAVAMSAAVDFTMTEWTAPDGFSASLSDTCTGSSVTLRGPDGGTDGRRARFLAWAVAGAQVVAPGAAASRDHVSLRLTRAALEAPPAPDETRVREACATLARHGATDPWLVALSHPPARVVLPVPVGQGETLLVRDLLARADAD